MDGPNHYDVRTGRWTAPDPIGDKGGAPDWSGYCLDDPVNGVDPAGLEAGDWWDVTANIGKAKEIAMEELSTRERRSLERSTVGRSHDGYS